MATIKRAISLALLAVSAPYIYDRLSTVATNRPGTFVSISNFKSYEIRFADKIRNCEDVILEESLGVAFLGCDPGRDRWNTVMGTFAPAHSDPSQNIGTIYVYDYATTPSALIPLTFPTWSESTDFHPLGLAFDSPSSKLYVINHSRHSGSVIEIFHVDLQKHSATHLQTFKHPLLHAPNSLELLGDGRLYVTNDHYIRSATSRLLAKLEGLAGVPGGSVVYVDTNLPPGPENGKVVARLPFANGIVRYNASTVVVASSSKPGLYFYTIAPNGIDLVYKSYIRTPAGPDNLSLDSAGKIMVAGHPFAPPLIKVAEGRPKCNEHGTEEQKKACGCWAPSWVGEWSEEGGLKTLLMESGGEVCSSSTAVRDVERGVGMVSMLYGKGIVVFKE